MESSEALKPPQKPDLSFNDDPAWFLEAVNYLDPEDSIDRLLIDYQTNITDENLPTAARQRVLIDGLKGGSSESACALIENHRGLIAAVAYPFKAGEFGTDELLRGGTLAFIEAAKTYDRKSDVDFSDYATAKMHDTFSRLMPGLAGDSFVELPERPMEAVYQFMETVQPTEQPEKIESTQERAIDREKSKLTPEEIQAVSLLHLKAEDIATSMGADKTEYVDELIRSLKRKLGAETREEAALIALQKGVEYDVVNIPGRETFTVEERLVAARLGNRNKVISEELGFLPKKVERLGTSLRTKTGARSRAEIAILANMHDFEPTEEELNPPEPPFIEKLSPIQEKVLGLSLHMQTKDIAALPNIDLTERAVASIIGRALQRVELPRNTKTALILELHRQGMEFEDLTEPDKPLSESLYAHEIEIAKLLHLPYEEIIEYLELDCTIERLGEIVYNARQKVGARTRQELALMTEVFYDETEAVDIYDGNNEWRLAKRLGLKALDGCDIDSLLSVATDREREVISAYYLVGRAVVWREVSAGLGIEVTTARKAAASGVARMIEKLQRDDRPTRHV